MEQKLVVTIAMVAIIYEVATYSMEFGSLKKYSFWYWIDVLYSVLAVYLMFTPFAWISIIILMLAVGKALFKHFEGRSPIWYKLFDSLICIIMLLILIINY